MNTMEIIITVINTLFGGAGVITFIGAKRERKAQANLKESEVFASWQQIYSKLVADTDKKLNEMLLEIDSLKKELSDYKSRCKFCVKN